MKKQVCKVSSVLVIAGFLTFIMVGSALGFGLKSLAGGEKKDTVSVDSLVGKQADLCKRLNAALGDIMEAQIHFANAVGDKETAERLRKPAEAMKKGNIEGDELIETMAQTTNVAGLQAEQLEKAKAFDSAKKRELKKGLLPYATGTAHSVLLSKEFADQLQSVKDAIKQAGITGAFSVKKKLALTLDVAPKMPILGSNLLTTANTAIKVAKKANLDVEGANDVIADL